MLISIGRRIGNVNKAFMSSLTVAGVFRPPGVRMGWSSEVVRSVVPYTSQILSSRGSSFEDIAVSYCSPLLPIASKEKPGSNLRRIEDSWLELILPLPDHGSLRESMVDIDGVTIRFGKLFEILDALAADVAYRHVCSPENFAEEAKQVTLVTACVDGMRNFSSIRVDQELRLQAYLSYVGTSSMEVCIDIIRIPPASAEDSPNEVLCGTIQFIMAARNVQTGKSKQIHQLLLHNKDHASIHVPDIYHSRFEAGKRRSTIRKSKLATSLQVTPPKADEVDVIHKLYLMSRELKQQKNNYLMGLNTHTSNTSPTTDHSVVSLLRNLQNGKVKWMSHTIFKNILLMSPQARNVHCNIFGGYIMRVAFEMGQVTAMCFFGESMRPVEEIRPSLTPTDASRLSSPMSRYSSPIPTFIACDDVQFVLPISIGAVVEFASTIIYSKDSSCVVQVVANEIHKYSGKRTMTNMFKYVFQSPNTPERQDCSSTFSEAGLNVPGFASLTSTCPQVMPREYDEFVLYLEGKRCYDTFIQSTPAMSSGLCTVNRVFDK